MYKCHRCKMVTHMSMARYNSIPDMVLDDFKRLGMGNLPTRDLEGAGFRGDAAKDLFRAGLWDPTDLHRLDRANEAERQEQDALGKGASLAELAGEQA